MTHKCIWFRLNTKIHIKPHLNIDLMHILFGSPLGISDSDVRQTLLICLIVVAVLITFRRDFMLYCFDPTHARSIGINTGVLHYLLLSILSLAAVAGLQTVGIILVVAMLITPGATAYLLTDRFDRMTILAVISSVISSLFGVYISYWSDIETGGSIVLVQTTLFLLAFLFAPRYRPLHRMDVTALRVTFTSFGTKSTGPRPPPRRPRGRDRSAVGFYRRTRVLEWH